MANHPSGGPRDEPIRDDSRSVFGANLRAARIKAGLTQAQLKCSTSLVETIASATAASSRPMARQASPHSGFETPRLCRSQSAASIKSGQVGLGRRR